LAEVLPTTTFKNNNNNLENSASSASSENLENKKTPTVMFVGDAA
jgi:hypothetical protein